MPTDLPIGLILGLIFVALLMSVATALWPRKVKRGFGDGYPSGGSALKPLSTRPLRDGTGESSKRGHSNDDGFIASSGIMWIGANSQYDPQSTGGGHSYDSGSSSGGYSSGHDSGSSSSGFDGGSSGGGDGGGGGGGD